MINVIRSPIAIIVQQHIEDAAVLRDNRTFMVSAPHVKLHHLRRLDDRLAAHLDGLIISGAYGSKLIAASLNNPRRGEIFTAAVRAIADCNSGGLERLLALAEALPESQPGLTSALGWVSAPNLHGITKALLESPTVFRRRLGLAACAMQQVDPGTALMAALSDSDASLRVRALRLIAGLGQVEFLPACVNTMVVEDADCIYEAARAAVFLGNRQEAIAVLHNIASVSGPLRSSALGLVFKLFAKINIHASLKELAKTPADLRLLIQGIGVAGDVLYIPWLIEQMPDLKLARLAGEALSLITGLDLAYLDFDYRSLEGVGRSSTDTSNDDNTALDDGLPWPDPVKIQAWWNANKHRFQPGVRYFMGEPPSVPHCRKILREGYQRQRIAAAEYLCLLQPGTKLFPTSAPAWRQERWLRQMG